MNPTTKTVLSIASFAAVLAMLGGLLCCLMAGVLNEIGVSRWG